MRYTATTLASISLLLSGLIAVPAFAQTASSYGNGTIAGTHCPLLSQTIQRGSSGNQVLELQKFISDYFDVSPNDIQTGYFGRSTQRYIVKFQKEQSLPTSGIVGSLTRTSIAKQCTHASSGRTMPQNPRNSRPSSSPASITTAPSLQPSACPVNSLPVCASNTYPMSPGSNDPNAKDENGCLLPTICVGNGEPPVTVSFIGPKTLAASERGTWTIAASDGRNHSFMYAIYWGDAGETLPTKGTFATGSTSVSHKYTVPGVYNASVEVLGLNNYSEGNAVTNLTVSAQGGTVVCPNGGTWKNVCYSLPSPSGSIQQVCEDMCYQQGMTF